MKIKPYKYYKEYYNENYHSSGYNILYTDTKHVYVLAYIRKNMPFYKYSPKLLLGPIDHWQDCIDKYKYKPEELSKADVFLELL